MFVETSSKDGTNVNELFKTLAASLPGLEGAEISSNTDGKRFVNKLYLVIGLQLTQQPAPASRNKCC